MLGRDITFKGILLDPHSCCDRYYVIHTNSLLALKEWGGEKEE
jgi:hypothetical protein